MLVAECVALCSDESERLWKAVDGAREAETVQLLRDAQYAKEVVFKKHPTSGAFLVHAAVDRNMQQVARELANPERYPGVLQHVDGQGCAPPGATCARRLCTPASAAAQALLLTLHVQNGRLAAGAGPSKVVDGACGCRRTALSIACNMRNVDLVVAFMAAGARDTRNDVDALHQTLIRTGDSARRAVLNKCALTTSFRRQHLSPAHAATSAPGRAAAAEDRARREREEGPGAAPARCRTDLPAQVEAAAEPDPIAEAAPAQPRGRRQVTAGGMNMLGALLRQPRTAAAAAGPRTIAAGTAPDNVPAATAPLEDVTNEQSAPPGFAESRLSQPRLSGTSGGAASGWLATDEYSSNGEDASFPDLGSKQLLKHGRHLQLASGSAAPPQSPAASLDRLPPGFGPNSASSAAGSGGGRGSERQAGGLRESVSAAHEASTKQPRRPGSAGKPTRGARERALPRLTVARRDGHSGRPRDTCCRCWLQADCSVLRSAASRRLCRLAGIRILLAEQRERGVDL